MTIRTTTIAALGLGAAFAVTLASGAFAQSASPQIPTLGNTNPQNPVATDGSPLPHSNVARGGYSDDGLATGRSVFAPVGAVVGAGVNTAGAIVGVVPATVNAITGQ